MKKVNLAQPQQTNYRVLVLQTFNIQDARKLLTALCKAAFIVWKLTAYPFTSITPMAVIARYIKAAFACQSSANTTLSGRPKSIQRLKWDIKRATSYIDFSGEKLHFMDPQNRKAQPVEVFIAV